MLLTIDSRALCILVSFSHLQEGSRSLNACSFTTTTPWCPSATIRPLVFPPHLCVFRPGLDATPSAFPSSSASPRTEIYPAQCPEPFVCSQRLPDSQWSCIKNQKYCQFENAFNILSLWGVMAQCMLAQMCSEHFTWGGGWQRVKPTNRKPTIQ